MKFFHLVIFLLVARSLTAEVDDSYKGCKIYRLTIQTKQQLDFLVRIHEAFESQMLTDEVDFWTDLKWLLTDLSQPILVMVSAAQQNQFLASLDEESIQHEVTIPDLAIAIEEESRLLPEDQTAIDNSGMTWTSYHSYSTIEAYLASLTKNYPELVREKTIIGRSYEGRNMYLLKIGKARPDGKTKPAIWMDSNIHAVEWIVSATVTYMVNRLVTEYETNSTCRRMLDEIDWYVLPVINVDGFDWTHSGPRHRLWRKSRSINPFSIYVGADPNRNYDHKWMYAGADQKADSVRYAGAFPFSEVENVAVTEALLARRKQIKASLSFHSYFQMWLTPWAYDLELPDDDDDLKQLGLRATAALTALYGTKYTVGSPPDILYSASGGTLDWAKAKAGIKYAYSPELRDRGRYGFLLPPNQIIPTGQETFEAINVVAEAIFKEFGPTLN